MKNSYEVRGAVTAIRIRHKGKTLECLIDTTDLPRAQSFDGTWHGMWDEGSRTYYVVGHGVLLHRFLTEAKPGSEVDHVNHYGLDNRRSQISVCDRRENAMNRQGANSNSRSGVRGVRWIEDKQRWVVQLTIGGIRRTLGLYETKEQAQAISERARRDGFDSVPPRKGDRRRARSLTGSLTVKSETTETKEVA